MKKLNKRDLAATGIFTAFVAAATMIFSVYVPATKGYFNIGETMVYTTALLMGPWIGAFAGGFGSMLADLSLGYPYYAPGTLIIKAMEGFVVGYVFKKGIRSLSKLYKSIIIIAVALILGMIIWRIGTQYYVGGVEFSFGHSIIGYYSTTFFIPQLFWEALAIIICISIIIFGLFIDLDVSWIIISILLGGAVMIMGYYFYEYYLLGIGIAALVEVPINMGQVTIGLIVAIPLYKSILKILPNLKHV
ncbi:MAG: ECF transporter S component [Nitrososphaerales archaeon]